MTDADRGSAYAGDDADGGYTTRSGDSVGYGFASALLDDPGAIEERRRELEASVGRIDRGLSELAGWLDRQVAVDRVESARAELEARGLAL